MLSRLQPIGRATAWFAPCLLLLLPSLWVWAGNGQAPPKKAVAPLDFGREIRPILSANCFACHGPDAESRKAGLRLDTRTGATADRGGYAVVVPGDPARSSLITRITATNPQLVMPPPSSGHRLTAAQKVLLTRWIKEGAKYDEHWAFKKPVKPSLPTGFVGRNGIDAFVQARLRQAKLTPAPEADRSTLIRRVSLDLIGLPPTPAEVDAFVQDKAPNAYEKVVDRLLASPRFGEHWARMWLDLARYADTKGSEKDLPRQMWRYRDWVIDAYNADIPFDKFTVEQLAGDLLPSPTPEQLVATAFHRNTMNNDEGGTDDEEFRILAVKDRIDTTIQVWMGLTMGCAKCHSHKYDPISHEDYYRFYAIFNQTEDADRYDDAPTMPAPTADERKQLAALNTRVANLREAFWKPSPEAAEQQKAWEKTFVAPSHWTTPTIAKVSATSGATFTLRADGALVVSGTSTERDVVTATIPVNGRVTALRLEALKDDSLPNGGPGRDKNDQNSVISEVNVVWQGPDGKEEPVALSRGRADFEQGGWPAMNAFDGNPDTGWAYWPQTTQPHIAIFDLKTPLEGRDGRLVVRLTQNYARLQLGCFRLSVTDSDPKDLVAEFRSLGEIAATPPDQRSPEDKKRLEEAFRCQQEPFASIGKELASVEKEKGDIAKRLPNLPVMQELAKDKQRKTRIHQRGNFLDPGAEVQPAVLPGFGVLPSGGVANRLQTANWLVSPQNPLTPRVEVNRIWARFFGTGIVETEEDFGTQGTPPSHRELLDWLAVTFRDDLKWSHKKLCRLIVTSATYRQSSRFDPAKVKADPRNRLLSHGPRFRLSAEVVRDQALAASGLLSAKVHGPSVMPPQPEGIWRTVYSDLKWETSPGEDRYRRALYTFTRRTSPYPALTTFDAGSGEVCTIRRIRTNTPLQALVTLNDPAFVEAAGALARRVLREGNPHPRQRVAYAFRLILSRAPSTIEVTRLVTLLAQSRTEFHRNPKEAEALLKSANLTPAQGEDIELLAAWTVLSNVLLNLDETLTKP